MATSNAIARCRRGAHYTQHESGADSKGMPESEPDSASTSSHDNVHSLFNTNEQLAIFCVSQVRKSLETLSILIHDKNVLSIPDDVLAGASAAAAATVDNVASVEQTIQEVAVDAGAATL